MWEEGELNTASHFPSNCFKSMASEATIGLISCETGRSVIHELARDAKGNLIKDAKGYYVYTTKTIKKTIGQHLSNEAQKKLFAPTIPIGAADLEVMKTSNSSLNLSFRPKDGEEYTAIFFPKKKPMDALPSH